MKHMLPKLSNEFGSNVIESAVIMPIQPNQLYFSIRMVIRKTIFLSNIVFDFCMSFVFCLQFILYDEII